ncbi:hypothetical protein C8R46DRAFT_1217067 [Mycena filopes]|nr:hypothetical protein C8R46DRAFT_1217067 [Mycena filopes]
MRFTILSVLSAISVHFLARAAPVGEDSALPPVARSTNASADVFDEIHLPPRQAEDAVPLMSIEYAGSRGPGESGCVVA